MKAKRSRENRKMRKGSTKRRSEKREQKDRGGRKGLKEREREKTGRRKESAVKKLSREMKVMKRRLVRT